jgi:pimeloyl-ACP methyl ester carboxylesterase
MKFRTASSFAFLALLQSSSTSPTVLPVVGSHCYDVATTTQLLTDAQRRDPFANDGRPRSVMVSGFYPTKSCREQAVERYMPPATAAFQNDKFAAYGLPNGSFEALGLKTCKTMAKPHTRGSSPLPLVLFSGALSTSRLLYSNMLQSIAAAGYTVVSIDHPYDADAVEYPNGTLIRGVPIDTNADIELALATRVADIKFVYDHLTSTSNQAAPHLLPAFPRRRAPKTAVIGHSLGGAAAAAALLAMPALHSGLNLDGSLFGRVLTTGLDRPFMLVGHANKTQATDPSWAAVWPLLRGWKREFEVTKAAHYSFSDLPAAVAALGLQDVLPVEVGDVLGRIEGGRMAGLTVRYVCAFLDRTLKGVQTGFLDGGSAEFPEVKRVA